LSALCDRPWTWLDTLLSETVLVESMVCRPRDEPLGDGGYRVFSACGRGPR